MARVWTRSKDGTKRLAPCLVALFDQADARWPKRSIASDGTIGDPAHAARTSDHNPDASGDVLAGDLTDDKANGCDADLFADHLRTTRDRRVKYVICNGRVFRSYGTSAWKWTPYTGVNAHEKHTHVSVLDTPDAKNDLRPWFPPQEGNSNANPTEVDEDMAVIIKYPSPTGDQYEVTDWLDRRGIASTAELTELRKAGLREVAISAAAAAQIRKRV